MAHGERMNSLTHLLGLALALVGSAVLIAQAAHRGTTLQIVSFSVFSLSMIMLYAASTLYHSLQGASKEHWAKVDHCAIYLLIAGTYTPFMLVSMRSRLGWTLLGIVWTLAVAGVVFKSLAVGKFPAASATVYIMMGWCIVFGIRPLLAAITWPGMIWLIAGGLAYTLGIVFFANDRLRYFHALWHLFVLAGSVAHYFAVLLYVVPRQW